MITEVETELEASFAIELVRSNALRALVAVSGRDVVYIAWKLGWIVGKQAGLAQAEEIFSK